MFISLFHLDGFFNKFSFKYGFVQHLEAFFWIQTFFNPYNHESCFEYTLHKKWSKGLQKHSSQYIYLD